MPTRNALFVTFMIGLCAAAVPGAGAQETAGPRIYQVGEIAFNRYVVLERMGIGSWRSALFMPTHPDQAGAVAMLREEAARLGADGIVNLHCLSDSGGLFYEAGYYCYANAIKLK